LFVENLRRGFACFRHRGTYRAVILGMFDAPRLCALAISSVSAVIVAWILAPDGYQDDYGFHFLS
jgi:hypothetical protein